MELRFAQNEVLPRLQRERKLGRIPPAQQIDLLTGIEHESRDFLILKWPVLLRLEHDRLARLSVPGDECGQEFARLARLKQDQPLVGDEEDSQHTADQARDA